MEVRINPDWKEHLKEEFQKPYFNSLIQFVRAEYATKKCYPSGKNIFSAFDSCSWDKLKVVIIGQDPYHGPGQANGLCFSVNKGIPFPPSLINIFREIQTDLGQPIPQNGDLFRWSEQGVLLLNATLTVRAGEAGSHQGKGWEIFTDAVIKKISDEKQHVVFLLWGGYARGKVSLIDKTKHFVLESGHPSPLSANRGLWFGNRHFSKCNDYLKSKGLTPIMW
ncbi:MAG: uracil-DNA glycosylase [Flavobacteriia bacterium]|nr:uracil-DNA glycosylase [Flavobacteriia bacterium]OJX36567.1 MAG: uracil-DNA glycosylase [Flavobacteriia bacterium 40-80]